MRGISAEIERLAKVEAARRGVSLSEFVSSAIIAATRAREDDAERRLAPLAAERAWYETHRDAVAREHHGKIVAICGGAVVFSGESLVDVANAVRARLGDRPVYAVDLTVAQGRTLPPSPARGFA